MKKIVDVSKEYFGVSFDQEKMRQLHCDDLCCEGQNCTMQREDAIEIVVRGLLDRENTVLLCSEDAVKASLVKDFYGNLIFPETDGNLSGWLFMWDKMPFANWGHECEYFFVVDSDQSYNKCLSVGLTDKIRMEIIE